MLKKEHLNAAVEELAAIPYFPQGVGAKAAIAVQLAKFASDTPQLRWLVDSAINAMREWKGVGELRGLYCTRYRPTDGIEASCSLAGYTPEESEAARAHEIYTSPWKELPEGNKFESDIEKLAKRKRLQ